MKSSDQKKMDRLEKYFRDDIHNIHDKLKSNSEEREYLIMKLNVSLEYIEEWRDEIIGNLPDYQCSHSELTETATSIADLYDKVANMQRGICKMTNIGISNSSKVTTLINWLERNQISICPGVSSLVTRVIQ